jgi:hypothetical protein
MNPTKTLSWKSAIAIAALVLTVPAVAQKRRAVQHPAPPGPAVTTTVTGKVVDAATGLPVVSASIRIGEGFDRSDSTGSFSVTAKIYGQADLVAERTGYNTGSQPISGAGPHVVTISLQSKPTVKLRLTDGTQKDMDFESVEFGYVPPFSSYVKAEFDDFCKPNGTAVRLSRTDFARITGPAITEAATACCANLSPQKITATLKTGEATALYFSDSCLGYTVDFIARDHVTGRVVYTKFANIAEIIFP